MFFSIFTRAICVGWCVGGVFVTWSDRLLYRAATLGILLLFHYLWTRAAIRRAADARFAAVLEMAESRRR